MKAIEENQKKMEKDSQEFKEWKMAETQKLQIDI